MFEIVALLAEGVDRNFIPKQLLEAEARSPSSRRAWIEMQLGAVAAEEQLRRPPRGGRG